jgi:hypothetical protein
MEENVTAFAYLWRIIAILFWALFAAVGWIALLYVGLRLYVYGRQQFDWPPLFMGLPEWAVLAIFWGTFGVVPFVVTVAALLLGISGRLPGTRERARLQSGFPVEPVSGR